MCFQCAMEALKADKIDDAFTHALDTAICANQGELCDCPRGSCAHESCTQSLGSDAD